jgi:hypothetical protein
MPIWATDLFVTIVLIGTSELAFRVARRKRTTDEATQLGTAQASTLGLLALILGFTLAMAESRFDARRRVLLDESLAVGTTYLRTDFLPEPQRTQSQLLLREYVQARIDFYGAKLHATAETEHAQTLHTKIWAQLAEVAPTHDSVLVGTYATSLNEMIDLETSRDVMLRARVPWTIHVLLLVISVVAVAVNAYAVGLGRRRVPVLQIVIPLLVAFSYAVLLDLDRSRAGFITTGDLPMERLQKSLPSSPGTSSARASGHSF